MEVVDEAQGSFPLCVPAGQPAPCPSHEYPCGLGVCLNVSLVCSGQQDCVNGSDEGGNCSLPCQLRCSQLCHPSPQGPVSASSPHLGGLHCSAALSRLREEPHAHLFPHSDATVPLAIGWLRTA